MAYFDDVKIGDKVYDLVYGWGKIHTIEDDLFWVEFNIGIETTYSFDGKNMYRDNINQTLFWDEIQFTIPEPPKKEYKFKSFKGQYALDIPEALENVKGNFSITFNIGLYRHTKEQVEASLERNKKANRLEMLVYDIQEEVGGDYYVYRKGNKWEYNNGSSYYPEVVLMYKETAKRVCEILNNGEYKL